ncbi:MAG TPA: hypothetical protein VGS11_12650 [Candidatus Bathyarchaeia archaeon]|nr:hypothetical protein [Candidatus Bathyarchaeia archaeon]
MIPSRRKVSLTTYTWPVFLVVSFIVVVVLLEYRRAITGSFDGLKGGSQIGLALAYTGSLLLVAAQFYTIVKRSAWIGFIKAVGGVRPWLSIHITLSFIGLIAVLVHAGFPYQFNQRDLLDHGLAGLTTWLLVASAASGVFGRYVYKRLPAMKKVFAYWKPSHLLITGLLFLAAIIHMITAFGN